MVTRPRDDPRVRSHIHVHADHHPPTRVVAKLRIPLARPPQLHPHLGKFRVKKVELVATGEKITRAHIVFLGSSRLKNHG